MVGRALLFTFACSAAACADQEFIVADLPPDVATVVVVKGAQAWLIDRASADRNVRFDADAEPVTVLYYAPAASDLLLSADGNGALIQARSVDPPDDQWPLPPTARGRIRDDGDEAFTDVTDAAELAARVAAIKVPAAPCADLEVLDTERLDARLDDLAFASLASIGDVALLTAVRAVDGNIKPRAFFLARGASRELVPERPVTSQSRLSALLTEDGFRLVDTSTGHVTIYDVSVNGDPTRLRDLPSVGRQVRGVVAAPSFDVIFGRDGDRNKILRMDTRVGQWSVLHDFEKPPPSPKCETVTQQQPFHWGTSDGVVAFTLVPPHVFTATRSMAPTQIAAELALGTPCQSAYARFPGGAELVMHTIGAGAFGKAEVHGGWRAGPTDPWRRDDTVTRVFDVTYADGKVIALDPALDDVVVLGFEPRRPDRRPRICARLGVGRLRQVGFDGELGVAILQQGTGADVDVVRFRYLAR